jgi:hypothetical protein
MNPASEPSGTSYAHPRSARFSEVLDLWDKWDDCGRDASARAALCLEDRYYLLVNILKRTDAWHPWIYARCREVEDAPDGYIDIWGREHYKSTVITYAGLIQEVLRDAEITIGIFSHTKPIAKAFLAQIKREFEANEELKTLFPDVLYQDPQKESPVWSLDAGIVVKRKGNPKEATIEAHGLVDGQPTSKHFRLMDFDDVVTLESVNTPEQIQKTTEAWSMADNLGSAGGRKWHVGTRYHFSDTYEEIMKRGAAQPRIYPATDNGMVSGKPVLFTQAVWDKKLRDQLESTVACQLLCNPLAGSQKMFNVEDLQTYEARPAALMVYIMVDPARSKKKGSANTAMAVLGIDHDSQKYLLDGFDHKMDLMERWQNMRDLWRKWREEPGVLGVKVGYESFGAQSDLDYFEERKRTENANFEIELLEWPNDGPGSKDDRVQRLLPDIRSHAFFLPHPTDEDNLTPMQVRMIQAGYEYRLAQKILKRDENGVLYDLSDRFKLQVSFYPFTGLKDLIDAISRIYDLEPRAPEYVDSTILEPEHL